MNHKNALTKIGRGFAKKQQLVNVVLVSVLTLSTYFLFGNEYALSILLAGVIAIIPNVLFAHKAFKYAGASASKKVVESFFSGVKLKMALTVLLFALTFKFIVILPLPFFGTYFLVMAMPLLIPFLFKL